MNRFNIRVYGLWMQDDRLLVTDEIRMGIQMTKLPGGGLEFGEGLADGLRREWQEELAVNVSVGEIFYVNPFLQPSAFRSTDQVIAHYFWVTPTEPLSVEVREQRFDFPNQEEDQQIFRWLSIPDLTEDDFTFPIDQALARQLRAWWEAQPR